MDSSGKPKLVDAPNEGLGRPQLIAKTYRLGEKLENNRPKLRPSRKTWCDYAFVDNAVADRVSLPN
jgi:hypothetical protein